MDWRWTKKTALGEAYIEYLRRNADFRVVETTVMWWEGSQIVVPGVIFAEGREWRKIKNSPGWYK